MDLSIYLPIMSKIRSGIEILRSRRSLAVVAGIKKPEWPRRTDESRTLKKSKKKSKIPAHSPRGNGLSWVVYVLFSSERSYLWQK